MILLLFACGQPNTASAARTDPETDPWFQPETKEERAADLAALLERRKRESAEWAAANPDLARRALMVAPPENQPVDGVYRVAGVAGVTMTAEDVLFMVQDALYVLDVGEVEVKYAGPNFCGIDHPYSGGPLNAAACETYCDQGGA